MRALAPYQYVAKAEVDPKPFGCKVGSGVTTPVTVILITHLTPRQQPSLITQVNGCVKRTAVTDGSSKRFAANFLQS